MKVRILPICLLGCCIFVPCLVFLLCGRQTRGSYNSCVGPQNVKYEQIILSRVGNKWNTPYPETLFTSLPAHNWHWIVSSVQAILSVISGIIVIGQCHKDIIHDRFWLTDVYARFCMSYFLYDVIIMYLTHLQLNRIELNSNTVIDCIWHFVLNNKALVLHHLALLFVYFPVVFFCRRGLGDFFIGISYVSELAVPFIAVRHILVQVKMKDTPCYILSGLLMIGSFFICRILVFPYAYWRYSAYAHVPIWKVPSRIPIKCNIGCLAVLLLQMYWLIVMVRGAVRVFYKIYIKYKS